MNFHIGYSSTQSKSGQRRMSGLLDDDYEDIRVSIMDIVRDTFFDIRIPSTEKPRVVWDMPHELSDSPKVLNHLLSLTGMVYGRDYTKFLNCVKDSFVYGISNTILLLHDLTSIRPFLVSVERVSTVLTVVFESLEREFITSHTQNIVMNAMDTINPSRHIYAWRHVFKETDDGIHSSVPSGFHPAVFTDTSFRLVVLPHQRIHLMNQMQSGNVDTVVILNFDKPKWYYLKGVMPEQGEIHGISICAPPGSIPMYLSPQERISSAKRLRLAFKKLKKIIKFDSSELKQAMERKDIE